MKRKIFLVVLVSLLLLLTNHVPTWTQYPEDRVKAQFLERFPMFVQWPAGSTVYDPLTPFTIGVIGKNTFESYFMEPTKEFRIKGKEVKILTLSNLDKVSVCNVLFITGSEAGRLNQILSETKGKPILTISDTEGFAENGVLINFYQTGDNLRFEINRSAVQESGLRFSSMLFRLAKVIDTSAGENN